MDCNCNFWICDNGDGRNIKSKSGKLELQETHAAPLGVVKVKGGLPSKIQRILCQVKGAKDFKNNMNEKIWTDELKVGYLHFFLLQNNAKHVAFLID